MTESRLTDEILALLADPQWVDADRPLSRMQVLCAQELQRYRAAHANARKSPPRRPSGE